MLPLRIGRWDGVFVGRFDLPGGLRPSRYNTTTKSLVANRTLVYNALSGVLLELTVTEYASVRGVLDGVVTQPSASAPSDLLDRLVKAGCLLPRDAPEEQNVIMRTRARQKELRSSLSLTIAPTIQCNFRCRYCFEEHRAESMSEAVQSGVISLVTCALEEKPVPVGVTWFGGEPLLRPDIIQRVQTEIDTVAKHCGVESMRALITNGYLLGRRNIQLLKDLGEWDYIQITVDGAPIIHDMRRPLVNGRGTFERVVDNIIAAAEAGLQIHVRVNVDSSTASVAAFRQTLETLIERGVLAKGVRPYLGFVIDTTPQCSHFRERRLAQRDAALARLTFGKLLWEYGFSSGVRLPTPQCIICVADTPQGYVIAPSGLLFKCWNEIHLDSARAVGSVLQYGEGGPQWPENREAWEAYEPLAKSECVECSALPVCLGGCPWEAKAIDDDYGNCGPFKFFPDTIVQMAHADLVVNRGDG